jgi:transaldolase
MLFIDSSNIKEIERFYDMGIIHGVTCNPSILKKDRVKKEDVKQVVINICNLVSPNPVSVEVTKKDPVDIIDEAERIFDWSQHGNIVVKIPIHGANGEQYLSCINKLELQKIPINVTACMSANQGYLGASAGATYISLFGGRIADVGYNTNEEIKKLHCQIIKEQLKTQIIMGSVREVSNILDWLIAGSDYITVTPPILDKMIINPKTKETVQEFLRDAK